MKQFESKKNMNETQNKKQYSSNNVERHSFYANSRKPLFLEKSDYGWDGDY